MCHIQYFSTVLWCLKLILNISNFIDCNLKMNMFAKSIIILIDWLRLSKLPNSAICRVGLVECCDFSATLEPVTRNQLHGGNTRINCLIILSSQQNRVCFNKLLTIVPSEFHLRSSVCVSCLQNPRGITQEQRNFSEVLRRWVECHVCLGAVVQCYTRLDVYSLYMLYSIYILKCL